MMDMEVSHVFDELVRLSNQMTFIRCAIPDVFNLEEKTAEEKGLLHTIMLIERRLLEVRECLCPYAEILLNAAISRQKGANNENHPQTH